MNLIRRAKPSLSLLLHQSRPNLSTKSPYFTSRRQDLDHFRRRGSAGRRWYHNPRTAAAVTVLSGGFAATVYFSNLEPVPYTKRSHLVLLSPSLERSLGESQFQQLKSSLRSSILPPLHPDSIRVRLIASDIINALHRGLNAGAARVDYHSGAASDSGRDSVSALEEGVISVGWSKDDEVLDDGWVEEGRQRARGTQPATRHLEGLEWEVVVVRDSAVNALCLPGGKIVVFTGLLDHFRTDAEIAVIIGHEVGHAVARHAAEGITKNLWLALLQLIVLQFFFMPDLISAMSNLLLKLPFSRRMEMEADYIGLLLAAAAGYDPRVAPAVYEKLGKITGDSALRDYLSTHPSSKKRAQLLSQAKVMEEALAIYRETIAGRGAAGFL
ncbi:putative mitochondrial metalloendopeptidase OMA1 [Iris pallida]|uniref:Mitochondrial metalloendopeptidase OMA1 n=1 Tax=Iris pallida TaxID=29817 RepID=A0AAX6GWH2_IRIPA|nr:putative mitochondrial metalloendopeptidase OMA1 [Iris pallida]KAJ6832902.1 putative mitochondrial metalloendopeptidase OMA1 [Iris pallida]